MTTHTPEKLREEFEKWAKPQGFRLSVRDMPGSTRLGQYCDDTTQVAFDAWKSAHESFERSAADAVPALWVEFTEDGQHIRLWTRSAEQAKEEIREGRNLAPFYTWPAPAREVPCSFNEALNVIENWAGHGNILKLPDDVMRFRALADRVAPTPAHESFERGMRDAVPVAWQYRRIEQGRAFSEWHVMTQQQYKAFSDSEHLNCEIRQLYTAPPIDLSAVREVIAEIRNSISDDGTTALKDGDMRSWADTLEAAIKGVA